MSIDLTKMTPIEIYKTGFTDGAGLKEGHTLSIFGHDIDIVLLAIQEWDSRQPKLLYSFENEGNKLRVEKWPEGHVVWANGKIIWKSWE